MARSLTGPVAELGTWLQISGAPGSPPAVKHIGLLFHILSDRPGVLGTLTHTLQIISPKPSQPMEALKLRLGYCFSAERDRNQSENFGPKPPTPWLCSTSYFTDLLHTTVRQ